VYFSFVDASMISVDHSLNLEEFFDGLGESHSLLAEYLIFSGIWTLRDDLAIEGELAENNRNHILRLKQVYDRSV
jgi:hypothetical protein